MPKLDTDAALGELFDRVRALEGKQCGPWNTVGGTDPDSVPYEGTFTGTLQFRWHLDWGIDLRGSFDGGAVGDTIAILPDDVRYRPDRDITIDAVHLDSNTLAVVELKTTGELVYLA